MDSEWDEGRAPPVQTERLVEEAKCVVKQEKEAAEDTDDASSSNGSSDISLSEDSIGDIEADLSTYVTCLIDLEPMMERPIPDPQREQSVSDPLFLEEREPYQFYAELIKARFPKADRKLIEQLGQANWERSQRGRIEREANLRERDGPENIIEVAGTVVADSAFHDSGMGTSVPAQTAYAKSIVSFISSISGETHNHIPPLSQEAKSGKPFSCNACGKNVTYTRTRDWR